MPLRPIVGTLAYLLDQNTDSVLMIRRDARPDDDHYGKVNGLGGKVEPDEGIVESLRRELDEETGLELTEISLRGTITWTNFGPKREEWLGFVFLITDWLGTPPATNDEGTLVQIERERLLTACDPDADVRATGTCRCGRATATSCRWCSTRIHAPSMARCPTTATPPKAGATSGSER